MALYRRWEFLIPNRDHGAMGSLGMKNRSARGPLTVPDRFTSEHTGLARNMEKSATQEKRTTGRTYTPRGGYGRVQVQS
jgi:hypothetical protein